MAGCANQRKNEKHKEDASNYNTQLGIALPKDKPALKEAVDAAFKAIVADGTYANLVKKYGLPPSSSLF